MIVQLTFYFMYVYIYYLMMNEKNQDRTIKQDISF